MLTQIKAKDAAGKVVAGVEQQLGAAPDLLVIRFTDETFICYEVSIDLEIEEVEFDWRFPSQTLVRYGLLAPGEVATFEADRAARTRAQEAQRAAETRERRRKEWEELNKEFGGTA